MSMSSSLALQTALHGRLVDGLSVPVFDALPSGTAPDTYVLIGAEEIRDASDQSGAGAEHRCGVSVVSRVAGFGEAKAIASQITEILTAPPLTLSAGRIVGFWFHQAKAIRLENGALRRIDLQFRARTEAL